MIRLLILSFAPMLFSSSAYAYSECYQFNVSKFSSGLANITVRFNGDSQAAITSAQIVAKKSPSRFTSTPFACDSSTGVLLCSEAEGGGDFSFRKVQGEPVIKFVYLNLLIGSKGSVKVSPGQEINEEFAIYDLGDGNEVESEDDTGEMESEVSIRGIAVSCNRKK